MEMDTSVVKDSEVKEFCLCFEKEKNFSQKYRKIYSHIGKDTLNSIYGMCKRRCMMKNHLKIIRDVVKFEKMCLQLFKEMENCGKKTTIMMKTVSFKTYSCLFLKSFLVYHIKLKQPRLCNEDAKKLAQKLICKPELALSAPFFSSVLAENIEVCVNNDDMFSPLSVSKQAMNGKHGEHLLFAALEKQGISYFSEEVLVAVKEHKTPDALLIYPIMVKGVVVNWIESKCIFGDTVCHSKYKQNQYTPYVNRFGNGMVVYWYGFVSSITHKDSGILVEKSIPENITKIRSNIELL